MKRLLRHSKLVLLTVVLALGGLVTATASPAAHAASPSLYVKGQGGSVYVYGSGFNPYIYVRVELLNSSLTQKLDYDYIRAEPNGSIEGTFQAIDWTTPSYTGSAWVVADQIGLPSTWASTTIYPAPYITAQGGLGDVSVQGSGFDQGTPVTVTVFQRYICGFPLHLCTHVLATKTFTATTVYDGDAGIIYATLYGIPSGNVQVEASGTSIVTLSAASSNVVTVYVP